MKLLSSMKRLRINSFLQLRPIIFGLSVFNLIWMLAIAQDRLAYDAVALEHHVSKWRFYEEAFLASLLLLASLGLLLKRWWSHWVALILSSFLFYCYAIFTFWKLADYAEVPRFSSTHLLMWYPNLYHGQLLQILLSATIFCCAASSIIKWIRSRIMSNDV
jgi:hypothetical protein